MELLKTQFPGAVCEEGHSVSSQENRVITGIRGGGGKGCPRATSAPVTLSEPKRANHVQCYHGRKLRNSTPHPLNSCPEPGSECLSGRVQSSSCRTAPRNAHPELGASRTSSPVTPVPLLLSRTHGLVDLDVLLKLAALVFSSLNADKSQLHFYTPTTQK